MMMKKCSLHHIKGLRFYLISWIKSCKVIFLHMLFQIFHFLCRFNFQSALVTGCHWLLRMCITNWLNTKIFYVKPSKNPFNHHLPLTYQFVYIFVSFRPTSAGFEVGFHLLSGRYHYESGDETQKDVREKYACNSLKNEISYIHNLFQFHSLT